MLDLIRNRRAIYPAQYNDEIITREELKVILEAANWAPTHRRTEPWRFHIFHSEDSRRRLADFLVSTYDRITDQPKEIKRKKIGEKPLQAGAILAICFQRDAEERVPEWEEIAATAMSVQNIWLQAHSMGIGGYWSSPALKDHIGDHIVLSSGENCLGFFYLGHYDGELPEGARHSGIEGKLNWY
ncbi:nitroreductase family protein [Aureitalea marina]|uniref:Putative NAD(P)H nitroreductase n=1 Tax=Aureitalea marina TaxID=930804 RepID=A0A2S7KLI8_9FLAO|nr:nitroreductase [Aureitalea marina]PQB03461.1 nitroreductase [Aureitalea marina]